MSPESPGLGFRSLLFIPVFLLSPVPQDPPQQRPGAGHCSWVTSGYVFYRPLLLLGWGWGGASMLKRCKLDGSFN